MNRFTFPASLAAAVLAITSLSYWLHAQGGYYPPGSSSGSSAFSSLTSGTNTTAAMLVGTGASLDFSGTGSINAKTLTVVGGITAGAVPFSVNGTNPQQFQTDGTGFCYDVANHRLGLGTCAPAFQLDAIGNVRFQAQVNIVSNINTAAGTTDSLANVFAATYGTNTNCSSATGVCGSAAAGAASIAAAATTVTVATTAVTANSDITITPQTSTAMGTRLSVTCNTTPLAAFSVSTITAGVSFVVTATAPAVNPACFSYTVVN